MINKNELQSIAEYVNQFLHESAASSDQEWLKDFPRAADHRWQHTLNVLANAEQILKGELASKNSGSVVRVAALLHDVSMFICDHSVHGQVSADMAAEYLDKVGFDSVFIEQVSRAIAEHGTDLGDIPPAEQGSQFSWEGIVLLEADILDKLGASTITSGILSLGEQHKLYYEALLRLVDSPTFERAEFFKDYIWTDTGRRMAERRFSFFLQYLERLQEEVVEYSMPGWDK